MPNLSLISGEGQSNMRGKGETADIPAGRPFNSGRLWNFRQDGTWENPPVEPLSDPTNAVYPVLVNSTNGVGPLQFAAEEIARYHPSTNIGLVLSAKGGTSHEEWEPDVDSFDPDTLYGAANSRIEDAIAAAPGSSLKLVTFYQGESTVPLGTASVNEWPDFFRDYIATKRADWSLPSLPFVGVIIGPQTIQEPYADWTLLQTLQRQITGIGRAMMVDASDLTLLDGDVQHLSTASQMILGKRIGQAARILGAFE